MLLFFCALLSQVQILCCLWNFMHHLHQYFLCSAVNPHWYQIKLWQSSCSGHYNSSLAVLPCLCHRSSGLLSSTCTHYSKTQDISCIQAYWHKVNTISSLLSLYFICLPISCCGQQFIPQYGVSKHTYTQTDHAVPHYQLGHLYGILACLFFFTLSSVGSVSALLFSFLFSSFWQGKPSDYCCGHWKHKSHYLKWKVYMTWLHHAEINIWGYYLK